MSKWNSLRLLSTIIFATTIFSYFYLTTSYNIYTQSTKVAGVVVESPDYNAIVQDRDILREISPQTVSELITASSSKIKGTSSQDLYIATPTRPKHPISKVITTPKIPEDITKTPTVANHHPTFEQRPPVTTGYVLAESYWEQQTSGCRNLQNLQCWAGKYGMNVVEPFVEQSVLHTPFVTNVKPTALKFSDMFDIAGWNANSTMMGSSKLIPWSTFVQQAPRNLIVVQFNYYNSGTVKTKTVLKQDTSQPRYLQGCPNVKNWPNDRQTYALTKLKFKFVRSVCINFEHKDYLTLDEFHNAIFGEHSAENVTVYFRQWRGLGPGRILVKEGGCSNTGIQENMQLSERVLRDAELYTHRYLSSQGRNSLIAGNGSAYIAIIARLEKSKISFKKREGIVTYCLDQILQYHSKITKENSFLGKTFLAIDIGKYGSHSFRNTGDSSDLDTEFLKFFRELYKNKLTISAWEKSFQDISHTSDPGYIALLQKAIATKANCVLFVGGGSFQKHALKLYQLNHPQKQWCIHIVKECTLDKNLPFKNFNTQS